MPTPTALLTRLDEIGRKFAADPDALALIGLGSVGAEIGRIDQFSDLDFFAIVRDGQKQRLIADISWMTDLAPVAFCFQNTPDGYKLLYEDDILCEMAVFDQSELASIPFTAGRIVWKASGIDDAICMPQQPLPDRAAIPDAYRIGEALTNLYVGLLRDLRGEKLAAMHHIQHWALDHTLILAASITPNSDTSADPFSVARRFEQRYPTLRSLVVNGAQGYKHNAASARCILAYLDAHFSLNAAMRDKLLALIADAEAL